MRHAKSSWENPSLTDFDRPLLAKGIKRTVVVAGFLEEKGLKPDLIYSSGAQRAFSTAKQIINAMHLDNVPLIKKDGFYPGNVSHFLSCVKAVENECRHLMLIGHNPAISDLINVLALEYRIDWLKTSDVVVFEYGNQPWSSLNIGSLRIQCVANSKALIKNS